MNSRVLPLGLKSGAITLNVITYLEPLWHSKHSMNKSYYHYTVMILNVVVERIRFTAFIWNNVKVDNCSMVFVIQRYFSLMGDVQQVLFSVALFCLLRLVVEDIEYHLYFEPLDIWLCKQYCYVPWMMCEGDWFGISLLFFSYATSYVLIIKKI